MRHILRCPSCRSYTLRQACLSCAQKTINPWPAKFSWPDKFGQYRRKTKEAEWKERGWL